jgi:hypothetical protein
MDCEWFKESELSSHVTEWRLHKAFILSFRSLIKILFVEILPTHSPYEFQQWITNALYADHMTTAVRTGPKGSGAAGISVLVVPLKVEGVTLRKIKNTGVNASGSTYVELENVL